MHDGTKVKAFASGDRFRRGETLEVHLEQAREQVKAMQQQGEEGEPVSVRVRRRRQREAKEKLERLALAQEQLKEIQARKPASESLSIMGSHGCKIMASLPGSGIRRGNLTPPHPRFFKSRSRSSRPS